MLDLEILVSDMQALAGEVVASAQAAVRQRGEALHHLEHAREITGLREAIQRFGEDMALPVAGGEMGERIPPPPVPDYTVMATDGSQVAPDYHHIAPWYVINTGCAVFRYGAPAGRARCRLSSHPELKPPQRNAEPPKDEENTDARAVASSMGSPLEAERLKAELSLALRLLNEEGDPDRTVLLLDGPLVQWRMITMLQGEDRRVVVETFRKLHDRAQELRVPLAGFTSRSRAVEWVTLLRFTLCPKVASEGALCGDCRKSLLLSRYTEPPPGAHHAALAGLRDVELAAEYLGNNPGWRTSVLELKSRSWNEINGGANSAGFFYLHTGTEIGRMEIPQWVWEDKELMDRLHAATWDQCEAGAGYPMVLSEAHEAAVVRGADRSAFYVLIERLLNDHGVDTVSASAKAISKRRPLA